MKTVPLSGKIAAGRAALVDDEDYERVIKFRWYALNIITRHHTTTYAWTSWGSSRRRNQRFLYMHNLVMGQKGIDHRDHNGLNNQRANLRPATQSQNSANRVGRPGTSRFKGVYWDKHATKWRAQVRVASKRRHLGYFTSEEDAARAYDAAALAAWGEFVLPNFPEEAP